MTARSGTARESEPPKPSAPRPSVPNEPNTTFKRDGTAVLHEPSPPEEPPPQTETKPSDERLPQGISPVQVIDPALPAMSEESTPRTPRMQLFFVLGAVQTLPVWILAYSGSVRNLIERQCTIDSPTNLKSATLETFASYTAMARPSISKALHCCPSHSAKISSGTSSESCPIYQSTSWSEPTS